MKKRNYFKLILGVFCLSTLLGCDPEVSLENPNDLTLDTFFETLSQLEASANGAYNQLQTRGLYQRAGYILGDAFSDGMQSGTNSLFRTPFDFDLTPSFELVEDYWASCFRGIAACNFVLDGEPVMVEQLTNGTPNYTQADVDDVLGQARFLRGLYYYLLVKRYGGVPIITDTENTLDIPRSSADEVYVQIIDDFKRASSLLYDKGLTEIGRATSGSALGMLGKVYLHRQKYDSAKWAFDQISGYSLLPLEQYNDNFNQTGEYNDESMFEVAFSSEAGDRSDAQWGTTGQGLGEATFHSQEYTGWSNMLPSDKLIDEFETDDPRLGSAILQDGDPYGPNGEFSYSGDKVWYKFSDLYENQTIPNEFGGVNARILRYADVVLMRAEAENELGNMSVAIGHLNEIRDRVGLPQYGTAEMDGRGFPVNNRDQIFRAIVHERFVELCGEQQRFDDLVRWGMDDQEITVDDDGADRGYNSTVNRLIPIPQSEIDANANINQQDQNEGWR